MFIVDAIKVFIKRCLIAFAIIFALYCGICIAFPMENYDLIDKYSRQYNLEPGLVCAVINVESGFNPQAQSHKGARGLMQIMEKTALWIAPQVPVEDFTVFRLDEPDININIGCWYLKHLMERYNGNLVLAISAYNAGSGNVSSWLSDEKYSSDGVNLTYIPFDETNNYVKKIKANKIVYDLLIKVKFYEII